MEDNEFLRLDSATTKDTRWHEGTGDGEHGFMSKNQSISAHPSEIVDEDYEFTGRSDNADTGKS